MCGFERFFYLWVSLYLYLYFVLYCFVLTIFRSDSIGPGGE
jgi:hypothetical protein